MSSNWPFNMDDLNKQYGKDFGNKFRFKPVCPDCHGTKYLRAKDGQSKTVCPTCHDTSKEKR